MSNPWKEAPGSDAPEGHVEPKRLALEITFRGVAPLDDVVVYVRECGARIESVLQGSARCAVTAESLPRSDGRPRFGTRVLVLSTEHCVEAQCEDGDLYVALWRAFDVAMRRLTRTQSGVHLRPGYVEGASGEGSSSERDTPTAAGGEA